MAYVGQPGPGNPTFYSYMNFGKLETWELTFNSFAEIQPYYLAFLHRVRKPET